MSKRVDRYCASETEDSSNGMDPARDKKRKKRFSDEQVKSLESMFASQAKLGAMKKQQLAGELGLQPRQVSIWFQNKRARWKSKQLEKEFDALKSDYDSLLSGFESLQKEKLALTRQLQMLKELHTEQLEEVRKDEDSRSKEEERPSSLSMAANSDSKNSDPNVNIFSNFGEEEDPDLHMGQIAGGFSASADRQLCSQPSWPPDQSCNSSQWWEFWTMSG